MKSSIPENPFQTAFRRVKWRLTLSYIRETPAGWIRRPQDIPLDRRVVSAWSPDQG